jgi:hypothetical protein
MSAGGCSVMTLEDCRSRSMSYTEEVLPRTRGFTDRPQRLKKVLVGSPAHARVHRFRPRCRRHDCRFFRARAGSPRQRQQRRKQHEVLPRTRGFTGVRTGRRGDENGSPAYARVHPSCRSGAGSARWFSRVRAGSPIASRVVMVPRSVLLRPRWFTDVDAGHDLIRWGSPAHARVHRRYCPRAPGRGRFFRARVHRRSRRARTE